MQDTKTINNNKKRQNSLVKREQTNELQRLPEEIGILALDYINETLQAFGLSGFDINNPKGMFLPIAVAATKSIGNMFFEKAKEAYQRFREKGKIKEDYIKSDQHKSCLKELLFALEDETLDEKRFEVLNKIFLVASTEEISNRNDPLPLEYLRKCRNLTAGEILVLVSEYKHVMESNMLSRKEDNSIPVENWLEYSAKRSGLVHQELVEEHEMELINKHLLNQRSGDKNRYVILKKKGRLSDLGFGICEYIKKYDEIEKSLNNEK